MTTPTETPPLADELPDTPDTAVADAQDAPGAPEDTAEVDDSADDTDDAQDDDQAAKKTGVRARLKAAENRVAELEQQLAATRSAVFADAVSTTAQKPELFAALGVTVEDHLTDDGGIDVNGLRQAVAAAVVEHGLPQRPTPNPVVGRGYGRLDSSSGVTLGDALREHASAARR